MQKEESAVVPTRLIAIAFPPDCDLDEIDAARARILKLEGVLNFSSSEMLRCLATQNIQALDAELSNILADHTIDGVVDESGFRLISHV